MKTDAATYKVRRTMHLRHAKDTPPEVEHTVSAILADPFRRILWCSIKSGHIVCQHFNPSIMRAGRMLREEWPCSYKRLLDIRSRCGLGTFGTRMKESDPGWYRQYPITDDAFWVDVWHLLGHPSEQKIVHDDWDDKPMTSCVFREVHVEGDHMSMVGDFVCVASAGTGQAHILHASKIHEGYIDRSRGDEPRPYYFSDMPERAARRYGENAARLLSDYDTKRLKAAALDHATMVARSNIIGDQQ